MREIKLLNLLPPSLAKGVTVQVNQDAAIAMLKDEGFGRLAQEFMKELSAEMREKESGDWIKWNGYWGLEKDGEHTTLCACGGVYSASRNDIMFRSMLLKHVPKEELERCQDAMAQMFVSYLEELHQEKLGELKAGTGVTKTLFSSWIRKSSS